MNKNQAIAMLINALRKHKRIMNDDEKQAVKQFVVSGRSLCTQPCACMGPQRGEPLCPCDMKSVETVNGRYYKISGYPGEDRMSIRYIASGIVK